MHAERCAAGDGGAAFLCVFVPVGGVEAHVAQSAEHVLGKDEVSGSIPLMGSIRRGEQVVIKDM